MTVVAGLTGLLFQGELLATCIAPKTVKTQWTAFKTMKKIGVKGSFNAVEVNFKKVVSSQKPQSPQEQLIDQIERLSLSIDPLKLSTDNLARDKNIKDYFFDGQTPIKVSVIKATGKWITTKITLNSVTKKVPFRYQVSKKQIKASAHLDILDFSLASALARLSKACFSMHEGKTWSHVEVAISAKLIDCQK